MPFVRLVGLTLISVGFIYTMIRNRHKVDEFRWKLDAQESLSYREALAIYEMLLEEAVSLGKINSENIMEGLEVDLRIAKAINQVGL